MLSWGGYWRYPDYLDYFYLVTPYYPPRELVEELQNNFKVLLEQYPSGMRVNAELAASAFGVSPESIIVGNGAAELIKSMMGFIKGKLDSFDLHLMNIPTDILRLKRLIIW